jgi:hypothetical protein
MTKETVINAINIALSRYNPDVYMSKYENAYYIMMKDVLDYLGDI